MTEEDSIDYWLDCARSYSRGVVTKEHAINCLIKAEELANIQGLGFDAEISEIRSTIDKKPSKKAKKQR